MLTPAAALQTRLLKAEPEWSGPESVITNKTHKHYPDRVKLGNKYYLSNLHPLTPALPDPPDIGG